MLFMNESKKNISNDAIIDYEKSIKPKFFKFFLLALIPMLVILYSLFSNNLAILNYFIVFIIISLSFDLLAFYRLKNAIEISNYKTELSKFPVYFGIVIFGQIVTLIGLKFYLEQLSI